MYAVGQTADFYCWGDIGSGTTGAGRIARAVDPAGAAVGDPCWLTMNGFTEIQLFDETVYGTEYGMKFCDAAAGAINAQLRRPGEVPAWGGLAVQQRAVRGRLGALHAGEHARRLGGRQQLADRRVLAAVLAGHHGREQHAGGAGRDDGRRRRRRLVPPSASGSSATASTRRPSPTPGPSSTWGSSTAATATSSRARATTRSWCGSPWPSPRRGAAARTRRTAASAC